MMRVYQVMCRAIRVPAFVPPVLILINIYIIYRETSCTHDQQGDMYDQENIRKRSTMDNILYQMKINNQRHDHIAELCEKYNKEDVNFRKMTMSGDAYITPDRKLMYCDIPKVGCTYWKRIIRYLSHDYEGNINSAEEIPRLHVHFGDWNNTQKLKLDNKENIDAANTGRFKFTMTRDPYTRLWSGYLDKLFLPDFWWWLGTQIIKETRSEASDWARNCGHDVTFSEFLQFTAKRLKIKKHVDMHFTPIFTRCNPCQLKFDVIGKIETFGPDSRLILNAAEISHVTGGHAQKVDRALEEIRMLTNYNFDIQDRLIELGGRKECYIQSDIAFRIWKTFQYNGYIGDEFEFPVTEVKNIGNREKMKEYLLEKLVTIRKNALPDDIQKWLKQREFYLEKAYRNLPQSIKEGIRDSYMKDFELFDYDKEPGYIFS